MVSCRVNRRLILKGVAIIVPLFLGAQLLFTFLIQNPSSNSSRGLRPGYNQYEAQPDNSDCNGLPCDNSFHPKDIRLNKTLSNKQVNKVKQDKPSKVTTFKQDTVSQAKVRNRVEDKLKLEEKRTNKVQELAKEEIVKEELVKGEIVKNDAVKDVMKEEPELDIKVPLGVLKSEASKYAADKDGMFTCVMSGVRFQSVFVFSQMFQLLKPSSDQPIL